MCVTRICSFVKSRTTLRLSDRGTGIDFLSIFNVLIYHFQKLEDFSILELAEKYVFKSQVEVDTTQAGGPER